MNNWKESFLGIFRKNNFNQKRCLVCSACSNEKTRKYCVFCKKETQDIHTLAIMETIAAKESIDIGQRRHGIKDWIVKIFQGFKPSMDKDRFPEGIDLHRRLDREKDQYDEIVKDEKTGKIANECHEPLSEHIGHGSAKKK